MASYSGGLIIGLIFPERTYFYFILFYFFVVEEWGGGGGGGQGLIIGILRHVIFNEKSFRLLGILVKTPGARFSKFPKVFGPGKP